MDNQHQYPFEAEMVELPAIDMCASEDLIVAQVFQQMTTVGFLQLKNIEGFDEVQLLADIKEFFALPEIEKRKLFVR